MAGIERFHFIVSGRDAVGVEVDMAFVANGDGIGTVISRYFAEYHHRFRSFDVLPRRPVPLDMTGKRRTMTCILSRADIGLDLVIMECEPVEWPDDTMPEGWLFDSLDWLKTMGDIDGCDEGGELLTQVGSLLGRLQSEGTLSTVMRRYTDQRYPASLCYDFQDIVDFQEWLEEKFDMTYFR